MKDTLKILLDIVKKGYEDQQTEREREQHKKKK